MSESQDGSVSRNEGVLRLAMARSIRALSWGVKRDRGVWGGGGGTGDGGRLQPGMLGEGRRLWAESLGAGQVGLRLGLLERSLERERLGLLERLLERLLGRLLERLLEQLLEKVQGLGGQGEGGWL